MRTSAMDAAAAAGLVVMWSSGFIGADLGTRSAPADTLLAWRYLVAALLLGAWAWMRARPASWSVAALRRQAALGLLCQVGFLGGTVTGVGLGVPAGTAALIAALQPLLVAAGAGRWLGDPASRRQWWGLVAGVVGVGLVVSGDLRADATSWWAYLLPAGGMLALSAGTILDRHWSASDGLSMSLSVQAAVAAVVFVAVASLRGTMSPPAQPDFWWAVVWVVALSSFGGYGFYFAVLRRGGATRVSALLYLTPPTTMLWAFAMFGDQIGAAAFAGMLVCAVGVAAVLTPVSALVPTGRRADVRCDLPGT